MSDTLKPCPWCGASVYVEKYDSPFGMRWRIRHKVGPCNVAARTTSSDSCVAAWNTRALDAASYRAGVESAIIWFTSKDASTGDRMVDAHYTELADILRALPTPSTLPQEDAK